MSRVSVWTEDRAEQHFLEAIFAESIASGIVTVRSGLGRSPAISFVQSSLFEHPERPVALVLNTETEDLSEILAQRGTVSRILARASSSGWHLALAIPKLNAWAKIDPRIAAAFEADEATREDYYAQASRIRDLTRRRPFDVEALRAKSREFRKLEDFIQRCQEPEVIPKSAADLF